MPSEDVMDTDLLLRIDRLESRAEIGELCAAYCISCDDQDIPSLRALFTDDVEIRARNGTMQTAGIDDVMAMYERMFAIRGPSFHWSHDRFVDFDNEDPNRATGKVLAHAETTPDGRASIAALRYEDVYRRVAGRWLIARRELTFLYYMPIVEYAERLVRKDRVWAGDRWVDADYPEVMGPWSGWPSNSGERG